jgi:hypothetical protein
MNLEKQVYIILKQVQRKLKKLNLEFKLKKEVDRLNKEIESLENRLMYTVMKASEYRREMQTKHDIELNSILRRG